MTLGPVLPAGWDGDAWAREGEGKNSYWLRAWNKITGQFAIAQAEKYEVAASLLRDRISEGGTGRALITIVGPET
jgi:hypothetical protein